MDAEEIVLRLLASERGDNRLGQGRYYLWERSAELTALPRKERYEILWGLVSKGLVFIDIADSSPDNWNIALTKRGKESVNGSTPDPDIASPYIEALRDIIPEQDETVFGYAREAHRSYEGMCYFASVVMLGVASEVAPLSLFDEFGAYLNHHDPKNTYSEQLGRKKQFGDRFAIFRKFWAGAALPPPIKDNSDVWINAVAETIRKHRNEAGHAIVASVDRSTAHMLLSIFPEYIRKVYEVREWLTANTPA